MNMPIPTRQVHLDFHTGEAIPDVGADFDEKQFIECIKAGHVNSITVFASCMHGWSYYDTKVGFRHPNLKTNLLKRQLEACKKAGIAAPVYICVGWNDLIGKKHPDWVRVDKNGKRAAIDYSKPDEAAPLGMGHFICLNTPYTDYILKVTKEVMEMFNPVGIFYDVIGEFQCRCPRCLKDMEKRGINKDDEAQSKSFAHEILKDFMKKTHECICSYNPDARVFYNSSGMKGDDELYEYFTHQEIESLPTGGWGYDHFPQIARYFWKKGFDFLGMTGKFHRSWGEFGGFKNPQALKFECALMNSLGAKCSVGDQLHPSGRMDPETYRIIGEAYKYVEKHEKYWLDTEPVADIGVLSPVSLFRKDSFECIDYACSMMLVELHQQFDMIDINMDFSKYKVLILPEDVTIESYELKTKLEKFVSDGGALLLSRFSGMGADKKSFVIDAGIEYLGEPAKDIDYTIVSDKLAKDMVRSPFLNYKTGLMIKQSSKKTEVLAELVQPYFKRTYGHFCSHANTPNDPKSPRTPAVTKYGKVIYFAHRIFSLYKNNGLKLHRDLFRNALELLLPKPVVSAELPSCAKVILSRKKKSGELILNIVYAPPIKRGETEVIEDMPPLYNVPVTMYCDRPLKSVTAVNYKGKIKFKQAGRKLSFVIPEIKMHETILLK